MFQPMVKTNKMYITKVENQQDQQDVLTNVGLDRETRKIPLKS